MNIYDISEEENRLFHTAGDKYGEYFYNALGFNSLLQDFVKGVAKRGWIFVLFLSQVRKHHTLALLSATRMHLTQTQANLRQLIEAGQSAAYSIRYPDQEHFAAKDNSGLLDDPKDLAQIRYKWVEDHYPEFSRSLKAQKKIINPMTHSNLIHGFLNFGLPKDTAGFETPFFDKEEPPHITEVHLWLLGNLALTLMSLFHRVNEDSKDRLITLKKSFVLEIGELEQANHRLSEKLRSLRAIA